MRKIRTLVAAAFVAGLGTTPVWAQQTGHAEGEVRRVNVDDGKVTIRDLNRRFDWPLPDEEAATIAGLVIHEARRIPEVGQIFTFFGFRFEVLRRKRNQITSLRITAPKRIGEPPSH